MCNITYISYISNLLIFHMAKAILNITLDPEIKTEFVQFAKELGTTPSSLFSMFAKETLRTRKVSFSSPA